MMKPKKNAAATRLGLLAKKRNLAKNPNYYKEIGRKGGLAKQQNLSTGKNLTID